MGICSLRPYLHLIRPSSGPLHRKNKDGSYKILSILIIGLMLLLPSLGFNRLRKLVYLLYCFLGHSYAPLLFCIMLPHLSICMKQPDSGVLLSTFKCQNGNRMDQVLKESSVNWLSKCYKQIQEEYYRQLANNRKLTGDSKGQDIQDILFLMPTSLC